MLLKVGSDRVAHAVTQHQHLRPIPKQPGGLANAKVKATRIVEDCVNYQHMMD